MLKSRVLALILLAVLGLSPLPSVWARESSFTILFTNDQHGQLEPLPDGSGGVSRRATLIDQVRKEVGADKVVLVDSGDLFTGGALSGLTRGEADCAAYQAMGYDAVALGNHDLDYGLAALREYRTQFHTPWISANLIQHGMNPLRPYVLKYAGVRVGMIGFSTPETPRLTRRANVRGMVFNPPAAVAKGLHTILKKDADIFIAVSHLGLTEDKKLAQAAPFLHVIVGGHSHDLLKEPVGTLRANGSPTGPIIVQAGSRGEVLGRLDLTVEGSRKEGYRIVRFKYRLVPVAADVTPDPILEKILDGYRAKVGKGLDDKITQVPTDSPRQNDGDWPFACLAADAVRQAGGAEVALLNAGSFRQDLRAGALTQRAYWEIFPFDDVVEVLVLRGSILRDVLERSALQKGTSAFLQVSGVAIQGKPGALDITVNGEPLSSRREYKVAMNDYLGSGGDGYDLLGRIKNREKTEMGLRAVVEKALLAKNPLPASVDPPRWSLK